MRVLIGRGPLETSLSPTDHFGSSGSVSGNDTVLQYMYLSTGIMITFAFLFLHVFVRRIGLLFYFNFFLPGGNK